MGKKLLTVVVPTYNIESYIRKCIDSFKSINDKYYDLFEVLVINDGSHDNSINVVEEMVNGSDLDLKIINKENEGHGSTINRGIKESKGKYFKVVDGDDWVDTLHFEQFLEKLSQVDVDMVITDFTEQHIYDGSMVRINFNNNLEDGKVVQSLPENRIPMHALTYKLNVLKDNNITISENTFYVDIEYTLLPMKYVENYMYLNLDIYQYFLGRPDQSMNINVMKQKSDHHERVTKRILDFYHEIKLNRQLEKIVRDTLTYLIGKQCLLYLMNNDLSSIDGLFSYAEESNFNWKYDRKQKTTSLLYLNYKTKGVFSFVIHSILSKKKKEISNSDVH
ncbi:glycosyltransferase [Streptococcus oralis]|uniref:Glycosyltransferase family 2 protein n=1 Tax=Streptococcus oralis TaxID=1303 RepID=A0A7T2ZZ56_STROR|nr:glycosyltransferase family 2 protein [Streptococcus oralis]QPT02523.1 glycosyltransferase family 2 protein [Streptococcus oralis]CAK1608143.1 Glycosyltransferase family 2 protein [Streptococcus oralis subsp. dentisani]